MAQAASISTSVRRRLMPGLIVSVLALAPATRAGQSAVSLGEVRANAPAGPFVPALRRALEREVEKMPVARAGERFVLSATLERLDGEKDSASVRATAAVSLVLCRARGQVLHAVLNGHATAEESGTDLAAARDAALQAAVESAVRRLPEAVR